MNPIKEKPIETHFHGAPNYTPSLSSDGRGWGYFFSLMALASIFFLGLLDWRFLWRSHLHQSVTSFSFLFFYSADFFSVVLVSFRCSCCVCVCVCVCVCFLLPHGRNQLGQLAAARRLRIGLPGLGPAPSTPHPLPLPRSHLGWHHREHFYRVVSVLLGC